MRRLKEFNLSLLGKLVWRVLEERKGFWHKVLCARYVEVRGRLRFGGGGGLVCWKNLNNIREGAGMLEVRCWFDNIQREVGAGSSALFWSDPWLDDSSFDVTFSRIFDLAENKLVTVADMYKLGWGVNSEA